MKLGSLATLALLAGCATTPPPPWSARVRVAFDAGGVTDIRTAGEASPGRAVTADDPVRIASISKLVVALGVMRLVEAGTLDLDADVSDRLGWRLRNPAFPDQAITLRLLLSHRSSLTDNIDYAVPLGTTLREAVANPKAWDEAHPPGGSYRYTNLNFPVVASVMERATGERFDRLMDRIVLRPLGLAACFNWAACDDATVARAVVLADERGRPVRDATGGRRPDCPVVPAADGSCDLTRWRAGENGALFSPQGGLRISANGLARIGRLLIGRGTLEGVTFLSPASIDTLVGPEWTFDGSNGVTGETTPGFTCTYGLAMQMLATNATGCGDDPFGDGRRLIGHSGDAYNLKSGLWVDRARGTGIAYFVTAVPADAPLGHRTSFSRAEQRMARGRLR